MLINNLMSFLNAVTTVRVKANLLTMFSDGAKVMNPNALLEAS